MNNMTLYSSEFSTRQEILIYLIKVGPMSSDKCSQSWKLQTGEKSSVRVRSSKLCQWGKIMKPSEKAFSKLLCYRKLKKYVKCAH